MNNISKLYHYIFGCRLHFVFEFINSLATYMYNNILLSKVILNRNNNKNYRVIIHVYDAFNK